ncbi:DUF4367 domain-containing protein [Paenibacillus sp. CF384]|uniref:DUF4367 domain-containing protein n=1 Tax=Paenibacillus sp. CF384 TaxID=1884382 RepID=UPI000894C67B|nr:DUF4367 domain-containing protein [Paenibacillus sp. CF384]SDX50234.1 Transmembrane transcriptional regulator (anti-sigma factor RsiW) [Paenibacillus sp. CF384]
MTETDNRLRQHLREEADEILFTDMELSNRMKQKIRQEAAAEKSKRRFFLPKAWTLGLTAAIMIIAVFLILQQQNPGTNTAEDAPSTNQGTSGSQLSQLITTPVSTVEEAIASFGPNLRVPNELPDGYSLSEIITVGMKDEPVRDVIFTYTSGEKSITYAVSRMKAIFPVDLFTPTQVSGSDGYVFEQPELVELYWLVDDIQYSITGPLSGEEAMKIAESVK